jgi:aryl-alcohol dehydrogenase-like predicted oxidoreductase
MKLILGTAQMGMAYGINNKNGKLSKEACETILDYAWKNQVRMLDTAFLYGDSIEMISQFHEQKEFRFNLINKITLQNPQWKTELSDSFEKLKISSYYSVLFHSFNDYSNDSGSGMKFIDELKNQGKIMKTGVSVYSNEQLSKAIADTRIDLIQAPYNLLDNFNKRGELFALAKNKGKEIHVRSVFLQGLFFVPLEQIPLALTPLKKYLVKLNEIADSHHISIEALALQYVVQNDFIDGIVLGVDSIDNLRNNLEVLRAAPNNEIQNEIQSIIVSEESLLTPSNWVL